MILTIYTISKFCNKINWPDILTLKLNMVADHVFGVPRNKFTTLPGNSEIALIDKQSNQQSALIIDGVTRQETRQTHIKSTSAISRIVNLHLLGYLKIHLDP